MSILHSLDVIDFRNWKCIKLPGASVLDDLKLIGFVIILTDKRLTGCIHLSDRNQREGRRGLSFLYILFNELYGRN